MIENDNENKLAKKKMDQWLKTQIYSEEFEI